MPADKMMSSAGLAPDNCIVCVLIQLKSELSFTVVYPGTGGLSGYCSMNLPSLASNLPKVERHEASIVRRKEDE